MTFLSIPFLILFCITYFLSIKEKENRKRKRLLLLASYVFYAYWDVRFLLLMIAEEYICFKLACWIDKDRKNKKLYLAVGCIVTLGILAYFKYANFFLESFFFTIARQNYRELEIILPIGISFYTFQSLSYLIDIYRERYAARADFLSVSLYISFFPQLVAGPIVRADRFLPQLDELREMNRQRFVEGTQIFMMGAFKKAVIADRLAVCADAVFQTPKAYSGLSIACAVVSYSMQIYCDFSGYSDMATGVAHVFGYNLDRNFNVPYLSLNPTEFWKRWHISLSKWLQDYLYIPLGGNRKGKVRTYVNLFITMLLGGMWHGASWTFIVWGIWHGCGLIAHKVFLICKKKNNLYIDNKYLRRAINVISIVLNGIFVMTGWIFFRVQSLEDAFIMISRMLRGSAGVHYIYVYTVLFLVVLIFAHIFAITKNNGNGYYVIKDMTSFRDQFIFFLAFWLIIAFSYTGNTAFIYFQF